MEACQAGRRPITVLIAPLLVDLVLDTHHLATRMDEIVQAHRQSLNQAQRSEKRLPT